MPLPRYEYKGPIDHTTPTDTSQACGKSVIITGGANGMGEVCVREFVELGAFVTFADVNNERGLEVENELKKKHGDTCCAFVKCDIRSWEEQVAMFEIAKQRSPHHSVDVVIANAGISRSSGDSLWVLEGNLLIFIALRFAKGVSDLITTTDPKGPPKKPDLNIVQVNMIGTLYTWKLAVHYFRQQADDASRDRCFIVTGSLNAWIDSPGNWEYTASKYGLHGFLRTARRSSWEQGIRVCYVAPCWIKSAIRSPEYEAQLTSKGVEFGEQIDVARCMIRIACDKSINGTCSGECPMSDWWLGAGTRSVADAKLALLRTILDDHAQKNRSGRVHGH